MSHKTINVAKMRFRLDGGQVTVHCEHIAAGSTSHVVSPLPFQGFDRPFHVHFCSECAEVRNRLQIFQDEFLNFLEQLGCAAMQWN